MEAPILALVLFGGTALVILHDWLGIGGAGFDDAAGGYLYDAVVVAAGIALLLRSRAIEAERWAWCLLGAAVLCWAAGELYWTSFILPDPSPPYPSPADAAYLAFYPLAYAGLALLVRARIHELDWRLWTDGLIAALGTAALGTAFVFDFVADHTSGGALETATTLAYPLGDVAMLSILIGLVAMTGWRPGRTWSLLLLGLAAQVVADIAYTLGETDGVVPPGSWIDPIYLISAACVGALLWQPLTTSIESRDGLSARRELVVPAIVAGDMVALFLMQAAGSTSGISTLLGAATMVAVIARLALSARENRALIEQVRTDTLTGLGNRGGLQVDLRERCGRATAEAPLGVILYDLNGFKRYNDSFGHPEGDELLVRMGARLREAIGGDGDAYRIGGDEFCLLLTCAPERFEAVERRAGEALSADGPGFSVASSWGAATVPAEASDPSEALRLADVRMYARKEARRLASPGAPEPALERTV